MHNGGDFLDEWCDRCMNYHCNRAMQQFVDINGFTDIWKRKNKNRIFMDKSKW